MTSGDGRSRLGVKEPGYRPGEGSPSPDHAEGDEEGEESSAAQGVRPSVPLVWDRALMAARIGCQRHHAMG
jgi:hypothetical protein